MNQDIKPQIDQWATRQLADYDNRDPGTLFAEGITLSVKDAYELQTAVVKLREKRGERVIGFKVGCTSPTIRSQLGIAQSVSGQLFESEVHHSVAEISRADFANLAIEGELAVQLSRAPQEQDFLTDGIPACVARVFPVIELHHNVIRGEHLTAEELISNNAFQAGFVAGDGVAREEVAGNLSLNIYVDDEKVDGCEGSVLTDTVSTSLAWLTDMVGERGDQLEAGHIVLTGSIPGLHPIMNDCHIRVEAPPFGKVAATIVE